MNVGVNKDGEHSHEEDCPHNQTACGNFRDVNTVRHDCALNTTYTPFHAHSPLSGPAMPFGRAGRRRKLSNFTAVFVSTCLFLPGAAIWPFPPKRFTGTSLINAGSLGLSGDGRVVAFGDFNGDQLYVYNPLANVFDS